jgi:nickel-type superoxide dismutase maturation protease
MLARLRALLPIARYQVAGESMAPSIAPGERLLVNRAAYWFAAPRPGDLVVLRDPRHPDRLLLKRIEGAAGGGWLVAGDNRAASTDSRAFGPVGKELVVGKVWRRY